MPSSPPVTVVHPNDQFVCVPNGGHNSIAGFAIDHATGHIMARGHQGEGLTSPRSSNLDPYGRWLIVRDLDGGVVSTVSYDSNAPVEKTLKSFAINLNGDPSFSAILNQARGEKVEVTLQQGNAAQPGTVTGVILGMEAQHQPHGKDAVVEVEMLNVLCTEGIRSVPLSITPVAGLPDVFEVRGEVYFPIAAFEKLNREMEAARKVRYVNPRNTAASWPQLYFRRAASSPAPPSGRRRRTGGPSG